MSVIIGKGFIGHLLQISDLSTQIGPDFDGLGTTPFSPHYHNTYVMTEGGQLFSGVATDTMERDASWLRILPASQVLSTDKANDRWLNGIGPLAH